ncbi:YcjX family protein [Xinfangfangia sp. CPCC 101601]|uniref:YcjX family protein n=1 Tax=Pseudogemmobacter lacusdianii TaxID=3069608 RepID=A0ABU0VTA9_9RHOB|nr:YcjX family protein [Xinfangfangia sp. CPCC 101601]MDQ2064753.1 YcjX family protein [Xinfangfangia sp. CPCC 101601]
MAGFGITDGLARGIEGVQASVSGLLFEPVLRIGVTGLSRAGKTVFITGLIANLLHRGRMPQLSAEREGRIELVHLQPQPDMTLPRFDFEGHLAALTGEVPRWPDSTRAISELRLSFRVKPAGFLAGWRGPQVIHLDIVDYPGEWLLDLSLMEKSYAEWSEETLSRINSRSQAVDFVAEARAVDGARKLDEAEAQVLAQAFTGYLHAAREAGFADCTPGRFLLPGDLAGSPVLTFAPLPQPATTARGSLWREMERRYEAYKSKVVTPFFRDHFAKLDRQVVLMDVLGALHQGPQAVADLRRVMAEVLGAFRVGRASWLTSLLGAHRVEKILFAATKADHLHHEQHPQLTAITEALLAEAKSRAAYAGAEVAAMSIASVRATVEERVEREGESLPAVRGRLLASGKQAVMYPGALPHDPLRVLNPAREGAAQWLDADFALMGFAPARMGLAPGQGLPHIRLDRAAEFLFGDRL